LLAIVDLRRELRRLLSPAWDFASLGQSYFPGSNRIALDEPILRAMATLALAWGWIRTAACLRLCFFAMLRPAELLGAKRRNLVLPPDLLRDPYKDPRVFLRITAPKTQNSGARQQFGRSDDWMTTWLWIALSLDAPPETPLWEGAPALFRARWNALCRRMKIPFNTVSGVTPGSLRAGGASALYEASENLELVRHRGRWGSSKMAEIYIQEVGGHQFLAGLAPEARHYIHWLASQEEQVFQLSLDLLRSGVSPDDFPAAFATRGLLPNRIDGKSGDS
jgi:integrase